MSQRLLAEIVVVVLLLLILGATAAQLPCAAHKHGVLNNIKSNASASMEWSQCVTQTDDAGMISESAAPARHFASYKLIYPLCVTV